MPRHLGMGKARARTARMGFEGRLCGLESGFRWVIERAGSEGDHICAEIAISGQI